MATDLLALAGPVLDLQRRCPLVRAALRLGDDHVLRVVIRLHPAVYCPAARREARDRVVSARG